MAHLSITVRQRGVVFDARTVEVRGPMLVGEHPEARVGFPGVTLQVAPVPAEAHPHVPGGVREGGVAVGGVVITPGRSHTVRSRSIEIEFELAPTQESAPWRRPGATPLADLRLLVACAAVVVFGLWVETLERWAHTDPGVVAELSALPALWSRVRGGQPIDATDSGPPAQSAPEHRLLPVEVGLPAPSPSGD